MSLQEVAIDLLNEAKSTRDVQSKIYILEQIKEIVFHRDQSILSEILAEVTNFMVEKSVPLRKSVIIFVGQGLKVNMAASISSFISLIDFFTKSEAQDNILQVVARELNNNFTEMIIHIANMPLRAKVTSSQVDPIQIWTQFRSSLNFLVGLISSDRSDNLRSISLKLAESMILFGLPPPPPTTDPRLARVMRSELSNTAKSKNAEDIPLHHSFINRNEVVQEAEDLYSKMMLWSSRNGPQGFTFSTALVSLLGESIASVAVARPKKGNEAVKAITAMIQSKTNICASMSSVERGRLARASHRLLRIAQAFTDPDGSVAKLRTALSGLEALGIAVEPAEPPTKKRSQDDSDKRLDDDDETELNDLRSSAKAAVDALERQRKSKSVPIDAIKPEGDAATKISMVSSAPVVVASALITEIELSSDLASLTESQELKNIQLATLSQSGGGAQADMAFAHAAIAPETYKELSLQALLRMLDAYSQVKIHDISLKLQEKVIIRTAVTLSYSVIVAGESFTCSIVSDAVVPVITALPLGVRSINKIDTEVRLPRPIWTVISFVIYPSTKSTAKDSLEVMTERLSLLYALIQVLFDRIEDSDESRSLYEAVVYVIAGRMLQSSILRQLLRDFIVSLPVVPHILYSFLQVLMYYGSKPPTTPSLSATAMSRRDQQQQKQKNRGTKAEAMILLGELASHVQTEDEYNEDDGSYHCLNVPLTHLLWATLSDDFELRSKAVSLIIR